MLTLKSPISCLTKKLSFVHGVNPMRHHLALVASGRKRRATTDSEDSEDRPGVSLFKMKWIIFLVSCKRNMVHNTHLLRTDRNQGFLTFLRLVGLPISENTNQHFFQHTRLRWHSLTHHESRHHHEWRHHVFGGSLWRRTSKLLNARNFKMERVAVVLHLRDKEIGPTVKKVWRLKKNGIEEYTRAQVQSEIVDLNHSLSQSSSSLLIAHKAHNV